MVMTTSQRLFVRLDFTSLVLEVCSQILFVERFSKFDVYI